MAADSHRRAAEFHSLAAHAHEAAAVSHDKGDHLKEHELTKLAKEHSRNALEHSQQIAERCPLCDKALD